MDRSLLAKVAHEWLEDDVVRARVRTFALSMQAIRLIECGFEAHINTYSPAELLLLSTLLPTHHANVLYREARERADNRLLCLLERAGCLPYPPVEVR